MSSQPQKPQQPPRPYVVRSHGVAIAIVIAHRPESAISTVVTNQYTAEVPSALELLEFTRQNMQVIDPLGALPPAFGPAGNKLPPDSPQQQLPIGNDLGNSADPRRYTLTYRSGDVLERIDRSNVIDELSPLMVGAELLLRSAIDGLAVGGTFDDHPEFTVERVA